MTVRCVSIGSRSPRHDWQVFVNMTGVNVYRMLNTRHQGLYQLYPHRLGDTSLAGKPMGMLVLKANIYTLITERSHSKLTDNFKLVTEPYPYSENGKQVQCFETRKLCIDSKEIGGVHI